MVSELPEGNDSDADGLKTRTERRLQRLRRSLERRQPDLHLVLENVHDPHNVSAVVRTCDAVGVDTIHLVYNREEFPTIGKVSSSGAWKWVNIRRYSAIDDCYSALRQEGCAILATALSGRSTSLYEADLAAPVALVFGNEHRGVSDEAVEKADGNIEIPMVGLIQSLNISVACAVSLYEAMRQRIERGLYEQPRLDSEELVRRLEEWARR